MIQKEMINHENLQYYTSLFVGENKKEMSFIYDTGSTHLWVPLNNCTGCQSDNLYSPTSTFESTGEDGEIVYGSGNVSGEIAYDVVSLTSDTESIKTSKLLPHCNSL